VAVCPNKMFFDGQEFLRQFRKRAIEQCIPLTGSIDLTHRCNLRCVHCYVRVAAAGPTWRPVSGSVSWMSARKRDVYPCF